MTERIFYSFHYQLDLMRASQLRNIGTLQGNEPAPNRDWETIANSGDKAIKDWINAKMEGRSCTVVLIGQNTAGRKWINYEISKSWNDGMGIVGIRIHGLQDADGFTAKTGGNPFDYVSFNNRADKLSSIVDVYDPEGSSSHERQAWIAKNLEAIVEKALTVQKDY
jgi:hypothetical protein